MAKSTDKSKCEPKPKDPKPTHECGHGVSIPNRPGPAAAQHRKQTGHY
jgi:hypothetical protein